MVLTKNVLSEDLFSVPAVMYRPDHFVEMENSNRNQMNAAVSSQCVVAMGGRDSRPTLLRYQRLST